MVRRMALGVRHYSNQRVLHIHTENQVQANKMKNNDDFSLVWWHNTAIRIAADTMRSGFGPIYSVQKNFRVCDTLQSIYLSLKKVHFMKSTFSSFSQKKKKIPGKIHIHILTWMIEWIGRLVLVAWRVLWFRCSATLSTNLNATKRKENERRAWK